MIHQSWPKAPTFCSATARLRGPVFWTPPTQVSPVHPCVAGVLTQEVIVQDERLRIGVVVHADYIREAVDLLDQKAAPAP